MNTAPAEMLATDHPRERILAIIREHADGGLPPPTVREISRRVRLSPSTVQAHILHLQATGAVVAGEDGQARTLRPREFTTAARWAELHREAQAENQRLRQVLVRYEEFIETVSKLGGVAGCESLAERALAILEDQA